VQCITARGSLRFSKKSTRNAMDVRAYQVTRPFITNLVLPTQKTPSCSVLSKALSRQAPVRRPSGSARPNPDCPRIPYPTVLLGIYRSTPGLPLLPSCRLRRSTTSKSVVCCRRSTRECPRRQKAEPYVLQTQVKTRFFPEGI
jgi:hypothetical protein